jgi:hypothetical protein
MPSTAFACSFVDSLKLLSEKQKHTTRSIINCGKRPDGTFLFDHSTPLGPPQAAPAPAPAPRGTTRQREFADDGGMTVKNKKRGE